MKKFSLLLSFIGIFLFAFNTAVLAQEGGETATEEVVDEAAAAAKEAKKAVKEIAPAAEDSEEEPAGHQLLMKRFIEGGPGFMGIVLVCLILGLAFCIERIISLSLASTNSTKLLESVEEKLKSGNVEGAKEICKSNRSPIASIMYQGLTRVNEGIDNVEKSIISYGSVQMGLLERGLVWIALFIALAPMLGFMGTVIGMIDAFDAIEAASDISPSIVAGGIKVALLTTVFGLIVAVILQIFYNYIVSRIDGIVNDMEDSSITFVDMLKNHNIVK